MNEGSVETYKSIIQQRYSNGAVHYYGLNEDEKKVHISRDAVVQDYGYNDEYLTTSSEFINEGNSYKLPLLGSRALKGLVEVEPVNYEDMISDAPEANNDDVVAPLDISDFRTPLGEWIQSVAGRGLFDENADDEEVEPASVPENPADDSDDDGNNEDSEPLTMADIAVNDAEGQKTKGGIFKRLRRFFGRKSDNTIDLDPIETSRAESIEETDTSKDVENPVPAIAQGAALATSKPLVDVRSYDKPEEVADSEEKVDDKKPGKRRVAKAVGRAAAYTVGAGSLLAVSFFVADNYFQDNSQKTEMDNDTPSEEVNENIPSNSDDMQVVTNGNKIQVTTFDRITSEELNN